jgi:hypothetical protein
MSSIDFATKNKARQRDGSPRPPFVRQVRLSSKLKAIKAIWFDFELLERTA